MLPAPAIDNSLESFCECLRTNNPFLDNRVNGPDAAERDAAAVHPQAFARLTELAAQSLAARRGLGVVVWGEAGIGKSHLLARLGRWAESEHHAQFAYLHNLQAAPEQLPRALLRHVVTVLTHGRRRSFHLTPLFELIHAGVVEAVGDRTQPPSWPRIRQRFGAFLDRLSHDDHAGAVGFDRSIYDVLLHFFESAYRARLGRSNGAAAELAARWLAGQTLEWVEAQPLGLPAPRRRDEAVLLEDAQQIKQVFVALSRLAASNGQPFILAFDQVDNLDNEQFAALSRFLEALLDSAPNLLVVTAGVRASLEHWRELGVVQHSAWDRLGQFEIALQRLNLEQAKELLGVRLDNFLAPFADLEAVQQRRHENALFPLGNGWFQARTRGLSDVRPRDVVNWAREGWREQQEQLRQLGGVEWLRRWPPPPPAVPPPVSSLTAEQRAELIDRLVEQRLEELRAQPVTLQNLPADAEQISNLLLALLQQCRQDPRFGLVKIEPVLRVNGRPPAHSLDLVQQLGSEAPLTTAVLVLTAPNATAVAAALRRLAQKPPPVKRLVLLTDERIGLPLAEKGKTYHDKLDHQFAPHFHHLRLPSTEYATLQALQTVVREARSGDLEIRPPSGPALPVREVEVIASHHRRDRYRAVRVLTELLSPLEAVALR